MNLKNEIPKDWLTYLSEETQKEYFIKLNDFVNLEYQSNKIIYPEFKNIFNALKILDPKSVKVVILGQDPYHGPNQAHGLSFSVENNPKLPPSLKNIYKELCEDIGIEMPSDGNLTKWCEQGVLLLNSVLTVEGGKPNSHKNKGWEVLTSKIIEVLNNHFDHIVFILWGSYAQKKGKMIDPSKHLILSGHHPSPLSSYRGFFGCKHFSLTNKYLQSNNKAVIDWQI